MPISGETRAALDLLKDVQAKVRQTENLQNNHQVNADLTTLISVLESPVFQSILNIQDSLRELKRQVQLHPSILPSDFDITPSGELVLNLPPSANATSTPAQAQPLQNPPQKLSPAPPAAIDSAKPLVNNSGSLPRQKQVSCVKNSRKISLHLLF